MIGMVWIQLVCKVFRTLMTRKIGWAEILRIPLCSVYYTAPIIFPLPRIFIALDVRVAVQSLWDLSSRISLPVRIPQLQRWNYVGKTRAQVAHRWFLRAKAAHSLRCMLSLLLMALLRFHEDMHAFAHCLNFSCYCCCHSRQSDTDLWC
jgi:hypothetical protein